MGDEDKTRHIIRKVDTDEVFEVGDPSVAEKPAVLRPQKSSGAVLPWMLFVLTLGAAGAGAWLYVLPQKAQLEQAQIDNEALKNRADKAEADARLLRDKAMTLEADVEKKDAVLRELTATKDELEHKLKSEIAQGDVIIKQYKGELVVDLVDQILFASGEAELGDKGKEVLRQVGETLLKVPDKVLQIGGHTDNQAITGKLKDKWASNWELSSARALNVVHFLQEEVKIPGERLVAAGFSEFRPIGKNASKDGRKRNRRIEVTLLAKK